MYYIMKDNVIIAEGFQKSIFAEAAVHGFIIGANGKKAINNYLITKYPDPNNHKVVHTCIYTNKNNMNDYFLIIKAD